MNREFSCINKKTNNLLLTLVILIFDQIQLDRLYFHYATLAKS
jgi:hypothetical protein